MNILTASYKEIISEYMRENFDYIKNSLESQPISESLEEMVYDLQNELGDIIDEDPETNILAIKRFIADSLYHKFLSTIIQRNLDEVYREWRSGQ